ncbi:sensor histidine kinase [Telluribacter humicola]|uniref:sensor histidine kinase n=1 Tax=Telluribacter humicola TaxID=1720261 RepID=UPI001A963D22|nr:histidine kinase [Telluribacter humicola]
MKLADNYRVRIIGIAVITALRFGFYSSEMLAGTEPFTWEGVRGNFIFTFISAILMWEISRAVVVYYHKVSPISKSSDWRLMIEALYLIAANGMLYVLTMAVFFYMDFEGHPRYVFLLFGLLDRILYGILIGGFYELLFLVKAWNTATQEAEQLKKVNLLVQLESLKNQVKPHFLFNSLNTLTGLVEKDPDRAVKFIAELSKVYRYLLQSNEKELIGLTQELQFTEAYFFLLQTRFGTGISLDVRVDEAAQQLQIPPLTLQILVENAVKHNQVSVRKPLRVEIRSEDGKWLVVENNFQPKRQAAPSNGMGLNNITTKYRLLNQPQVQIFNDETNFTVKVPLLTPIPA